jgi:hypothetical protein
MDEPAHHVLLELRLDGESVTGSATALGEPDRAFAGWLGLVAAVEALVGAGQPRDQGSDPVGRPEDLGDGTAA